MKVPFRSFVSALSLLLLTAACSSDRKPDETAQADSAPEANRPAAALHEDLQRLKLPEGFRIDYYARNVTDARSMAISPSGIVFVGTRSNDKVYALVDRDGDGQAEDVVEVATGLDTPNGVAYHEGALYVAEVGRILRYPNIEQTFRNKPQYEVVTDKYPTDQHHGWKYIAFGPDSKLYVPVGAPCNICKPEKPIYATITHINPDGSGLEIFAEGVRNSVGFDWHPDTKELWFTDNGRDMLGDNLPPDELNRAPQKGLHFGYPYCHAGTISDPEFGSERNCLDFVKPARTLSPHGASLGMKFYTGSMFPERYRHQIFIAEHGSWNRSDKIGYRLMLASLDGSGNVTAYEPFAEGWLQNGTDDWGRPVDVLVMPDGALLVSDDKNNAVYRITYQK
ncbi:sorbosone dehydrogenase family protein [Pontibacter qinzhouensis]|uniref:Sorbosone dehydrogenase family protein n=1 Tax=Pontibacter qinzhouensis TaxID=2603253 RepID=A0A5C8KEW2_9BACT|nr:sorbosone dehydrogenase family protein [Pontibacter qinzhouensis]TXK51581.1 sorbosone dehydrogenase family protein [Pontibacter qinzhouensis]